MIVEAKRFFPTQRFLADHCFERTVEGKKVYYVGGSGTVLVNGSYVSFSGEVAGFRNDPYSKASKLRFKTASQQDLVTLVADQKGYLGLYLAAGNTHLVSLLNPKLMIPKELTGHEMARLVLKPGVNAPCKRVLISPDQVMLGNSWTRPGVFRSPAEAIDFLLEISQSIVNFK